MNSTYYVFIIAIVTIWVYGAVLVANNQPEPSIINSQAILIIEQGIDCISRFEDKQLIITCNKTK